jgi:hypothetical protein
MIEKEAPGPSNFARFFVILFSFCLLDVLSWPIFFSYYLWVFADRSSFLNLDYLLGQHLHLGVDTYYAYGLLPVFIQHVLFVIFGRGYWPMIGCTIVVLTLMALFWSLLVRRLSNRWIYVLAVVAISPILLWINPNFPYSLVQLSMLFALLFLLEGRPEPALAISVIGCFSVPSMPLILTGLLGLYILVDWWTGDDHSVSVLARRLAPGALTYALLVIGLSAFFSFRSVLATALPFMGVRYYYVTRNNGIGDLLEFIHPAGHSIKYYVAYYIGSPAGWWLLTTIGLIVLGVLAGWTMIRNRRPDPRHAVVLFCAIVQVMFALIAYRNHDQHIIYDPIAVVGALVAISIFPVKRFRNSLLILFVCIGVMSQAVQARQTVAAWKNTHPSPLTANLYAEPEYGAQMSKILEIAKTQKVVLMSYATGMYHYYPTLKPVDSWFLLGGQMSLGDRERVLGNMRDADVIVEDTTYVPWFIERDPEAIREMGTMCLTDTIRDFQIWWRHPPSSAVCKSDPLRLRGDSSSEVPGK